MTITSVTHRQTLQLLYEDRVIADYDPEPVQGMSRVGETAYVVWIKDSED